MKNLLRKAGVVLGAAVIALLIYVLALLGLSFLADHFKSNDNLEPWLVVDSFLKPLGLVLVGSWFWLVGKFLKNPKLVQFGLIVLVIWVVVAIVPYFLSFGITPNS